MNIQFATIIDSVTAKKDGTISLKLGSQELSPEEAAHIFSFRGKQIWTAMSEAPINHEDLDIPEALFESSTKTPSQRLRSVLFILWKEGEQKDSFNVYYEKQMERFIEHIKEKLS